MDSEGRAAAPVGALRYLVAIAVVAVGTVFALFSASGVAYTSEQGYGRLREVAPALLMSVLLGLMTVVVVRALVGLRPLSAWLLLGAAPAVALSLNHTGIIG